MTAPPGQLFKGKFYYCEGTDTRNISTKAECRAAHYRWVRRKYNFDNLGQVGGAGMGTPPPLGGWMEVVDASMAPHPGGRLTPARGS